MIKNRLNPVIAIIFVLAVILISLGTLIIGKNATKQDPAETVDCPAIKANHTITIENDRITPDTISAGLCDSLTIANNDDKLRLMAFGVHSKHIAYDGVLEKPIGKGQSLTVTLNQSGTYLFHDHLQEEVHGQFNVQ